MKSINQQNDALKIEELIKRIRSIGWLNCANGSVNLTPCFDSCTMPTFINITRIEFNSIQGNERLMKLKAASLLL